MEVKLDYEAFQSMHKELEQSYENLLAIKAGLHEISSKSDAMTTFSERVKELEKLVGKYADLLGDDCLSFFESGNMFADMDSKDAAKYREDLYDARNMCAPD